MSGSASAAPRQDGGPLAANIDVIREPAPEQLGCLPSGAAVSHSIEHTATTFALHITVSAPLCDPVDATAAIYGMPGNGVAWPQRLVETSSFTISAAGTYDVVFTKTCDPVQFDVVTGATPEVIAPFGAWHGPLLFPWDVTTAHQHWGGACEPEPTTTTTTTSTTTTAPPAAVTSTVPPSSTTTTAPEVLSVSDEVPPPDEPPTTGAPEVLGETETAGPAALAFTGFGFAGLAMGGAVFVLVGLAAVELARRRSAPLD